MRVRLTQLDGKLPNLALMKLSHWHRARGDHVIFTRRVRRDLLEPAYDVVYGSAIFSTSAKLVDTFHQEFPGAVVSGTGPDPLTGGITVEAVIGAKLWDYEHYDYSLYPGFAPSLGFTARGCRLKCGFCVVPGKEGRPMPVNTIADIWRGHGNPKQIVLLDNDFFGQPPAAWQARIAEIRDGGFEVCFNQGLNLRALKEREAEALATVRFRNAEFTRPQLYTAWDNLGDEVTFLRGVDRLEAVGIPASVLLVYMLVGYDPAENWETVMYRFNRMVERGMHPYPMIYGDKDRPLPLGGCNGRIADRTLREFQRWVVRRSYLFKPFDEYDANAKGRLDSRQLDIGFA